VLPDHFKQSLSNSPISFNSSETNKMTTSKKVRLSIIIPCFNDGQFIKEALASVEACPDPIYEIIIVNDDSTDPLTCQVLNELKSNGYRVIDQINQGPAGARNTGIRMAVGEYILPLDSDNRIRPSYIYKGIEVLDRFPDVAVVYGDVELFGEETGVRQVPDFNLSWLVNYNYIDTCAVFRKSVWEECGSYDDKIPYIGFEDWDLWLSIAKKGHKFHHLPEVLFDYRVRPISVSTSSRGEEKAKLICRYIASKHAALFPKEYRSYFKPYRGWLKIWNMFQTLLNF